MKISNVQASTFIAIAALTASTPPAHAGGDLLGRPATSSNIASCGPGMKLRERVWSGADVYDWYETLGVACLSTASTAKWALVASTICGDYPAKIEDNSPPSVCFGTKAAEFPHLIDNPNFFDLSGQLPPYKLTYSAVKFAIGRDCHLIKTSNDPEYYANAWKCASLQRTDGSRTVAGQRIDDPRKLSIRHFATTSGAQFKPDDDGTIDEGTIPMKIFGIADQDADYDVTSSLK